jgi:hypothetical protein
MSEPKDYALRAPTPHLRFVVRDTGRILQQMYQDIGFYNQVIRQFWVDVPVVEEANDQRN